MKLKMKSYPLIADASISCKALVMHLPLKKSQEVHTFNV